MDVKKFLDLMADVVAKSLSPFAARVDALEKRQPEKGEIGHTGAKGLDGQQGERGEAGLQGKDGRDGVDGRDGAAGKDGEPGRHGERGADGIAGKDAATGRDGVDGKDGVDGERGADGKDGMCGAPGAEGKDGRDGVDGKDGMPGKDGATGRDGVDGKDGMPGKDGATGRDGVDGKDGKDGMAGRDGDRGADGKSLGVVDVQDWLEANFSKWALAAERRVYDTAEKAIAGMPKPVDGLQVKELEIDGRLLRFVRDGVVLTTLQLPIPIYRGVFDERETYDAHDMVTWGGSVWAATAATKSKPGTEDGKWKLAVKKGRDGKDAEKREAVR